MPTLPTQQFLEVDQIREGVMILKDKSLRAVMMVSSLNFALKSSDEQKAIIYQFQNFLNSLDFSVQILIQSRKLNITGYLDKLKSMEKTQQNELLKMQTTEYIKYIEGLVSTGTIMTKTFFVVIPYYASFGMKKTKKSSLLPSPTQQPSSLKEDDFQRGKQQLWQRMEFLALGLRRCALNAVPLTTPEIIELLWGLHHPKEGEFGYYPEIPPELSK